jgi:WD40 repeat protein
MIKFSPDGSKLLSCSEDKTIKLWNLLGKNLKTFKSKKDVSSISWIDNDSFISSGLII